MAAVGCGPPITSSETRSVLPAVDLTVCPRLPPQSAINKSANELALVTAHVARAAAAFNPDTAVWVAPDAGVTMPSL